MSPARSRYGLSLPSYAPLAKPVAGDVSAEAFRLALMWADPATGDQEAIDFTLALTAVDLGRQRKRALLAHSGRHPGGRPDR